MTRLMFDNVALRLQAHKHTDLGHDIHGAHDELIEVTVFHQ